jgi:hypothetical protein
LVAPHLPGIGRVATGCAGKVEHPEIVLGPGRG